MATDDSFLSRWSRRKSQARASATQAAPPPVAPVPPIAATDAAPGAAPGPAGPKPLPPVESLTPESDFSPFMAPEVDGDLRTKALKTLFADPRFNTMDMMDVYVDDYSKPDPLPESWLAKMEQVSRLGDRAGRDREEAERNKALAQAPGPVPPSDTPPEAPVPAEAAPPPEGGSEAGDTGLAIPTSPVGDSGT